MLFNTLDFIIFFIVTLSTIVIIKNRKFQHLFILFASYFFFYYTSNYYISLLIFTTLWDFYLGHAIYNAKNKQRKKYLLILSISANLGLLGFFKYTDFAITQFNVLGTYFDFNHIPLLNIALPIGISFYTFHSVGYVIDVYRGNLSPSKTLLEYATFIAFFPQLVAGPILRAGQFLPQLREKMLNTDLKTRLSQILIEKSNLKIGITMMALGFFKKMFIADNIAPLVNDIFVNPIGLHSPSIILGTITFGIQIYCDFSGYSDIAIGAAMIMGFKIPANFNKPFFATSPPNFWTRWHISLSFWVRDYLYFPIIFRHHKSILRVSSSLIMVMILLGIWHGANWNYAIFGLMHGLYLATHAIILHKFPHIRLMLFFKTRIGKITSIFVTQYLVFLAFIAFRVNDSNKMLYSMYKFVFLDFQKGNVLSLISYHKLAILLVILFIILHWYSYKKGNLHESFSKMSMKMWFLFIFGITTLIVFFYNGNPTNFIYFKF